MINWPILEKVSPHVLISGYPDQTLTVIGKNFIRAQPILADTSILWGHEVSYTVLSDTELLLEALPVLPASLGKLKTVTFTLSLTFSPTVPNLDILVID